MDKVAYTREPAHPSSSFSSSSSLLLHYYFCFFLLLLVLVVFSPQLPAATACRDYVSSARRKSSESIGLLYRIPHPRGGASQVAEIRWRWEEWHTGRKFRCSPRGMHSARARAHKSESSNGSDY